MGTPNKGKVPAPSGAGALPLSESTIQFSFACGNHRCGPPVEGRAVLSGMQSGLRENRTVLRQRKSPPLRMSFWISLVPS